MNGTLALAASIAAMDRQALAGLAAQRRIASPAAVHEPLGLAIELLRADSIQRALQSTHRNSLAALLAVSQGDAADPAILDSLAALGLLGIRVDTEESHASDERTGSAHHAAEYVALPEVTAALPQRILTAPATKPPTQARPEDLSGWFAAALTSVRRAAKLLHTVAAHPVRLGRKGQPAVVAVRDLAESAHCAPEQAAHLLEAMRAAGLLHPHLDRSGAQQLGVAEAAGQRWLMQLDYAERWLELARATIACFDPRLRLGLAETGGDLGTLAHRLPHDYPLLPESELESLLGVLATAEDLGLAHHGWITPVAEAMLRGDEAAARAIAGHDMPGSAAGIYLQPDLSIIVPGPLPAHDEAILHAISETEQLGPAASLRVSTDRLTRVALRSASATQELRAALERLSLTGIPQPLDYLLRDIERRVGDDAQGFDTAALDERSAEWLPARSRAQAEAVSNERFEAKQVASAEQEIQAMLDRVHSAARDAGSEGELTRRLELAIRDRSAVRVTAVAGTAEREFTLLPVSLKAGRLRATDQQAGVERTLPVSAITAVAPVAA